MICNLMSLIICTLFCYIPVENQFFQDQKSRFNIEKDLLLAHFDCKTDVDDLHSIAALKTLLSTNKYSAVKYQAVGGAYGIQGGLYVPPNELLEMAFPNHWSDAHNDISKAVSEVSSIALKTMKNNGHIWIAEAGQSDFTATLIKHILSIEPDIDTRTMIHVVQHSEWNQEVTAPENLRYVQENANYIKIADGNSIGNGTPGFRIGDKIYFMDHLKNPLLKNIWKKAMKISNLYNGAEGRYLNEAIASGGLDFSDVSESCWIFGIEEIKDAEEFFEYCAKN